MDLLGSVMLMTYSSKAATTTARYKLYVHYYRGFFGTSNVFKAFNENMKIFGQEFDDFFGE